MTDEKVKRPASQYYWGDWWKDKGLHSCSLAARGLWHEMNCLMHEGEPYGHLTLNGRPMAVAQLANQCRITTAVCKRLVDELTSAGVPGVADTGAFFSRRMVRDEAIRNARAAGGKAGAEHGFKGAEHGSKGGRPAVPKGGLETPLSGLEKPPPSSSSSSSSSIEIPTLTGGVDPPAGGPPDEHEEIHLNGNGTNGHSNGHAADIPDCDHAAVLRLWKELAPTNPQPEKWTAKRQAHLRSRWRELFVEGKAHCRDEALQWFAKYFRWIAQSRYLTGRVPGTNGRPPFEARLDWALIPDNLAKVIEGEYHREG